MKPPFLWLCLCAGAMLAQEIRQPVVPITQEPSHHLLFQNNYVRVFNVEVAPHFATRVHQHDYDYFFVTLGDSLVSNEKVHAEPVVLKLRDGETHFTPGGFAHKAVNLADTTFRNITIELLDPLLAKNNCNCSGQDCGCAGGVGIGDRSGANTSTTRYGKLSLQEGAFLNGEIGACQQPGANGPKLLVAITQLSLKSPARLQKKGPGGVVWMNPGECDTIATVGDIPARYVLIYFPGEGARK